MLRNRGKIFDKMELDLIAQFQSVHLKQQANERLTGEENKQRAKERGSDGQPRSLFLCSGEYAFEHSYLVHLLHNILYFLQME